MPPVNRRLSRSAPKEATKPERPATPSRRTSPRSVATPKSTPSSPIASPVACSDESSVPATLIRSEVPVDAKPIPLKTLKKGVKKQMSKLMNLMLMLGTVFSLWIVHYIVGPQCLPLDGICMPHSDIYPVHTRFLMNFHLVGAPTKELLNYITHTVGMFTQIGGIPRHSSAEGNMFGTIQADFIENHIQYKGLLPDGYKFFGNDDHKTYAKLFLQNNGLMASALQETREGDETFFDVKSYLAEGEEAKSWYSKIIPVVHKGLPRVNARFDADFNLVSMSMNGAKLTTEAEIQRYSGALVYSLVYYASSIHAMHHSFMMLYGNAVEYATKHSEKLSAWAKPYSSGTSAKYHDTNLALVGPGPYQVITGKYGFGGSKAVTPIVSEIFRLWGSYKTADDFFYKFMLNNISPGAAAKAGLLTQARLQLVNIRGMAEELYTEFKNDDAVALDLADARLATFLSHCGSELKGRKVSELSDLKNWIHLASITGILHGYTVSYTRTIIMPQILFWRNPDITTFDKGDGWLASVGMGTIVGILDDWHVFSASILNRKAIGENVYDIINKYDTASSEVKKAYFAHIREREDFKEVGWILTDNCPSGIDGKQQTIVGYV